MPADAGIADTAMTDTGIADAAMTATGIADAAMTDTNVRARHAVPLPLDIPAGEEDVGGGHADRTGGK